MDQLADGAKVASTVWAINQSVGAEFAGLGVSDYGDSLPVQIATALELYSKRKINWRSYGKPGIRAGQIIDLLPGTLPKNNLVIFVFQNSLYGCSEVEIVIDY